MSWSFCGVAIPRGRLYGALGILYIDIVNIAETSLHMHLLLELAWSGGVPMADLLDRYSAERMIAARLERLTSIGQVAHYRRPLSYRQPFEPASVERPRCLAHGARAPDDSSGAAGESSAAGRTGR